MRWTQISVEQLDKMLLKSTATINEAYNSI